MGNLDKENGKKKGHDKTVTIIVNAEQKEVQKGDLSFSEIVTLAFGSGAANQNTMFTVTYRRAHGNKKGSLVEGESVKVKEGMIFNVTSTDKS